MNPQQKALSLLSMARKAGKLLPGFAASTQAARSGQARLLVAAEDISEKTFKNLCYEADRAGVRAVRMKIGMDALGRACGVKAGVLAVADEGFAQAVYRALADPAELTERKKEEHSI